MITTGSIPKLLWEGVNDFYGQEYNQHQTEYTDIYETKSSNKAWEEIVGISAFGLAAVKPEGQGIAYDTAQQGFTSRFVHITYGLTH